MRLLARRAAKSGFPAGSKREGAIGQLGRLPVDTLKSLHGKAAERPKVRLPIRRRRNTTWS